MIYAKVCRTCGKRFAAAYRYHVYCGLVCRPPEGDGCHGKVQYESSRVARNARQKVIPRFETMRSAEVYRCGSCGKWHIGHRPQGAEEKTT